MGDTAPRKRVYKFIEMLRDTPEVEALGDIYAYLLAQADIVESNGRQMPFNIQIGMTTIDTRLIADGIAFGVLYEQLNPSKQNDHPPHIVAPFGYHDISEVIAAQENQRVADAMRYLQENPYAWKDPMISDELGTEAGIEENRARPLLLSAVFGTYIEVARLRDIELDDSVAEEIYHKYQPE